MSTVCPSNVVGCVTPFGPLRVVCLAADTFSQQSPASPSSSARSAPTSAIKNHKLTCPMTEDEMARFRFRQALARFKPERERCPNQKSYTASASVVRVRDHNPGLLYLTQTQLASARSLNRTKCFLPLCLLFVNKSA